MARPYRTYTDEDVVNNVKVVKSIAGLLRALGLRPCGGNYANIKKILQSLEVDTSHWTGQCWNKNERVKDWKNYARAANLKQHVITLRGHKCERCGMTKWLDTIIPLELHHIDGDRTNNALENLVLNCCNCHACTHNWRGRKSD